MWLKKCDILHVHNHITSTTKGGVKQKNTFNWSLTIEGWAGGRGGWVKIVETIVIAFINGFKKSETKNTKYLFHFPTVVIYQTQLEHVTIYYTTNITPYFGNDIHL